MKKEKIICCNSFDQKICIFLIKYSSINTSVSSEKDELYGCSHIDTKALLTSLFTFQRNEVLDRSMFRR